MKCPSCGAAELIHDTRGVPYTYKRETTTIPEVTGDFCQACGESSWIGCKVIAIANDRGLSAGN